MWAESYGVMPHVYILTMGPGSNGTMSWRAVSKSQIIGTALLAGKLDAGEADGRPGLVAHVELEQHGRDRLDGGGVAQAPRVEGAQIGDEGHQLGRLLEGLDVVR